MDDIGQRLRDAADTCIKSYEAWSSSKKDFAAREALQEGVHELRKVSARLEIEMAASERDEITQRQIPIPPHRASRHNRGVSEPNGNLPDFVTGQDSHDDGDSIGNSVEGSESSTSRPRSNPNNQGRTMQPRQQHRRPMRRPEGNSE